MDAIIKLSGYLRSVYILRWSKPILLFEENMINYFKASCLQIVLEYMLYIHTSISLRNEDKTYSLTVFCITFCTYAMCKVMETEIMAVSQQMTNEKDF